MTTSGGSATSGDEDRIESVVLVAESGDDDGARALNFLPFSD